MQVWKIEAEICSCGLNGMDFRIGRLLFQELNAFNSDDGNGDEAVLASFGASFAKR